MNCLAVDTTQPIGVERFVTNVLSGIKLGDANLICYTRRTVNKLDQLFEPRFIENNTRVKHTSIPVGSTITRILVEMLILPFFTFNDDVVLSINNFGPLWGKSSQSRILIVHDVWFMSPNYDGGLLQKWLFKILLSLQIKCSTEIITVSNFSKQEICHYFNLPLSKIKLITNCMGRKIEPHASFDHDAIGTLLLIGSDRKNKNIYRCIAGFCKYKNTNPNSTTRLVVIGKYSQSFLNEIKKGFPEHLSDIELAGYVVEKKLETLYQQCIGVLFPSLYEGFGLPAVEGFLYGKPVLVSQNTACAEILRDLAIIVDATDTTSIAEGIEQLMKSNVDTMSTKFKTFQIKYMYCDKQSKALTSILRGSD